MNVIKLTSNTFSDFLANIKAYIKAKFPNWTDFLSSDIGVALSETFAGVLEYVAYYLNRTLQESFPATAERRSSLLRHAAWLGYFPKVFGVASTEILVEKVNPDLETVIPAGTSFVTADGLVSFASKDAVVIPAGVSTGSVPVFHGVHIKNEILGVSDGSAGQRYTLGQGPVANFPLSEPSIDKAIVTSAISEEKLAVIAPINSLTVRVNGAEWIQVDALIPFMELGTIYMVQIDEDDRITVSFGDGTIGLIPPQGAAITADYLVGGGETGNVGVRTITILKDNIQNVKSVTNPSRSTGGKDRETTEELRENLSSQIVTRRRTVHRKDYVRMLNSFGEIERTFVDHPEGRILNVYIVPSGGGAPSDILLAKTAELLADVKGLTDDVRVLSPTLLNVNIEATIYYVAGIDTDKASTDLIAGLRTYLKQLEFAQNLYVQDVYDFFIQQPATVKKANITLMALEGQTGISNVLLSGPNLIQDGVITLNSGNT